MESKNTNTAANTNTNTTAMEYYVNYRTKSLLLEKCKIIQLKDIAKKNKLHISGTKKVLIKRIRNHFIQTTNAMKIQQVFRGSIVRKSFKMHGPAFKCRKICVNVSDGYTLEPLDEIAYERFFSYTDEKQFTYGFDILSLISVFNTKGKIMNPYNMELIETKIVNEITGLGKMVNIVFPNVFDESEKQIIQKCIPNKPIYISKRNREQERIILQNQIQEHLNAFDNRVAMQAIQNNLYLKMQAIRSKPIQTRIRELFIEIDLLGNYTQSSWFSGLQKRDYYKFYRYLNDIWNYRAQLTDDTKKKISQLYDPFTNSSMPFHYMDSSIEELQAICINVMENMVHGGVDVEYQKIGALHVLSVLTLISMDARNNMRWLFESLL